ncbi:MAG TPA: PKD domain-containing protein [Flavipsychrobacter sp.]|nr:PKD domain-containing protein [Flavipsychrobacter sp.]
MRKRYSIFIALVFILPFFASAQNAPLEFIENQGQWAGDFLYKSSSSQSDVYLEKDGFRYVVGQAENNGLADAYHHGLLKTPPVLKYHVYKMVFENAKTPSVEGSKRQTNYYNYFLGNDSTRWKTGIHPYLALDYKHLYDGIDVHVASDKGNLKYDFIVQPQADVQQIRLRYDGAEKLSIKDKNLIIQTSVGDVTELQPYAYQYIHGERKEVECRYRLKGNVITYHFPEGYDDQSILVIDPTVVFSTFSGSTADNWGFTATYDNQGNFYGGGLVNGVGYPVSTGAFQTTYAGGQQSGTFSDSTHGSDYACDIGIIKFNPTGTARIYATYIGGNDNEQPHSLIVDANNNLIIAGRTYSANYPVTPGCYDNTYNGGGDIVLTKLNAAGTGLIASTYLGGSKEDAINFNSLETAFGGLKHNYGDDARSEVLIDNAGNIYVTACTKSTDFPTTSTATQNTFQGVQDAIVVKLNSLLSSLIFSTYLGGSNNDAGYVLALDNTQANLYVGGGTASPNFPATAGTLWPSYQGGSADGFIAKFQNSTPYTLQKLTFVGQPDYDQIYGIEVDESNDVYVMGQTLGGTFPVSAGVYSNPGSSQFVLKTDANLSTNLLSTVFGSGNSSQTNISPVAFLVDTCHNIYISGWGGGLGFGQPTVGTTNGMPVTANAVRSSTDGSDFYFIVLAPNATSLVYATFYGAQGGVGEHVDGGTSRFDKNGVIYQGICAGCGGSSAFPTTPGVYSPTNGSTNCNFGALKIAFQLTNLTAHASTNSDTDGCAPLVITFQNNSINATTYLWDFGDGSLTDTTFAPTHSYNAPGEYHVKLIAFNPAACNKTVDTTYMTIVVDSFSIKSDFDYTILNQCDSFIVSFDNTSIYSSKPGAVAATVFTWNFGDGTSFTGANPPIHHYPDTGTYTVTLTMVDTTSCNARDSITKIITLSNEFVKADFLSDSVCVGNAILFSNASTNAQSLLWLFGNGDTATVLAPQYTYDTAGTYTVTLIAINPSSCNGADTVTKTAVVWPKPTADFSSSPTVPVPNEAIQFTNHSSNATAYFWGFGDGTTSSLENPSHLYKRTDRYKVCLEAKNQFGCIDQICKYIDAEIHPAIDVPTGFSPNGDGSNDVLYIRGAAVETLSFQVYNRWGEKVFETDNMDYGWDGNFKGKPQDMEAYAWVLDATFVDGTTVHRTGNVTLIR